MKTTLHSIRKYAGEEYKFFINEPEYEGEIGICGIEITPYIHVETPENGFGYADTVLMDINSGKVYTLHRYLQPWIKKKIKAHMMKIENEFWKNLYEQKGVTYAI